MNEDGDIMQYMAPYINALKGMMGTSSTSNVVLDEPRAWDQYIGHALAFLRDKEKPMTDPVVFAVEMADRILAERRKRFQPEELKAQIMPEEENPMDNLCGKSINGRWRCVLAPNHEGDCRPVTATATTTPAPPPIHDGPKGTLEAHTGVTRLPPLPFPPQDA